MELHLKIIGILLILLGAIHFFFPRYFYWKQELAGLNLMNRQMMYVHLFFIGFVVFLNGLLCLTSSDELLTTMLFGNWNFLGGTVVCSVLWLFFQDMERQGI
jgi:hypothetical protein